MDTNQEQATKVPQATPEAEHRWLMRLVGEWTIEADQAPGQPKFTGTETVRPLGEVWVLAEGTHQVEGGQPHRSLMTLGFDSAQKRFVGTWLGSMMTHLWVYDGQLSEDGSTLNLDCMGPSMDGSGKLVPYRDVIELKNDDERILRGLEKAEDGSWREFMVTRYRRSGR